MADVFQTVPFVARWGVGEVFSHVRICALGGFGPYLVGGGGMVWGALGSFCVFLGGFGGGGVGRGSVVCFSCFFFFFFFRVSYLFVFGCWGVPVFGVGFFLFCFFFVLVGVFSGPPWVGGVFFSGWFWRWGGVGFSDFRGGCVLGGVAGFGFCLWGGGVWEFGGWGWFLFFVVYLVFFFVWGVPFSCGGVGSDFVGLLCSVGGGVWGVGAVGGFFVFLCVSKRGGGLSAVDLLYWVWLVVGLYLFYLVEMRPRFSATCQGRRVRLPLCFHRPWWFEAFDQPPAALRRSGFSP